MSRKASERERERNRNEKQPLAAFSRAAIGARRVKVATAKQIDSSRKTSTPRTMSVELDSRLFFSVIRESEYQVDDFSHDTQPAGTINGRWQCRPISDADDDVPKRFWTPLSEAVAAENEPTDTVSFGETNLPPCSRQTRASPLLFRVLLFVGTRVVCLPRTDSRKLA